MTIDAQYLAIVPVLVGILAAMKQAGFEPRYIPTLAILSGILIGLMLKRWDVLEGITLGGAIGLAAIGAHSGVKNTLKK